MQRNILSGLSILSLSILTFACNNNTDKKSGENKALKDSLEAIKVLDTISHLPDVIDQNKMFNTENKRKLSTWIARKPGSKPFYWVAVGEDSGNTEDRLHFNFHVYPESLKIVFYDVLNNREIPLEEWREQNK